MTIDKGIKIQNIYYMLSYAFSALKSESFEKLGRENFETAADLLAAILAKGITQQIKRGLGKEYIPQTEQLSTLRGKIDISQSIKEQTMLRKKLVCNYDDFSANTHLNKIIKTTVNVLLKADINKICKKELKNLMMYFKDIGIINPYTIDWNIRFNRNNASYQMLINICYLIIKGLLQKDDSGDMKLQKFLDEQRMCKLYENFIFEYYKRHFQNLNVTRSQIKWNIEEDNEYIAFLPKMQSDITLSDKSKEPNERKILIIDAKYYQKSMATGQFGNKATFHSHNLYQIFTYVKNEDANNNGYVGGMLLYAKTDDEVAHDAKFNMSGNEISVKSLDLSRDFDNIKIQLNCIAENAFNSTAT